MKVQVASVTPLALPPELLLRVRPCAHLLDEGQNLSRRVGGEPTSTRDGRLFPLVEGLLDRPLSILARRHIHVPDWINALLAGYLFRERQPIRRQFNQPPLDLAN